jgi:hypothetical protein
MLNLNFPTCDAGTAACFEHSSVSIHEFFLHAHGKRYVSELYCVIIQRGGVHAKEEPRNAAEHMVLGRGWTCADYGGGLFVG